MEWEFVVALAIAIPIILFPAAFVWYLNAGGLYHAIHEAVAKRREKERRAAAEGQTARVAGTTEIKGR